MSPAVRVEVAAVVGRSDRGLLRCDPVVLVRPWGELPAVDFHGGRPIEEEAAALAASVLGRPPAEIVQVGARGSDPVVVTFLAGAPGTTTPGPGVEEWQLRKTDAQPGGAALVRAALARALPESRFALSLLPDVFTLGQLRSIHEAAWGRRLDPRNFRRRLVDEGGYLEPVGVRPPSGTPGRPPLLYRASDRWRALRPPAPSGRRRSEL